MRSLKLRLVMLNFLEFAVWGAYLTSLGSFLASHGLAERIGWFYAAQGLVSIFMPALMGMIADRWVQAQRLLAGCHLVAATFMLLAAWYASTVAVLQFDTLFPLYLLSIAFYMPSLGLSYSVAYSTLGRAGLDTVKHYPPIRVFGTVGFICSMLFTNFAGYQNTYQQLVLSGVLSLVLAVYALTLPHCPVAGSKANANMSQKLGLDAFKLFKSRHMALFFVFSIFMGVNLQITNGFANPFIQSFGAIEAFADNWGVRNANALISLSQMSETACLLLIPFFLKRFGIKIVMLTSMLAWVMRFGFFALGNPGAGAWLFVLSMIVYGIAFDFFNISGSLYVDSNTPAAMRSSGQGLFMLMTNGLGATIGMLAAQQVINKLVYSRPAGLEQVQGWSQAWWAFAAYALVLALLFALIFKDGGRRKYTQSEITDTTDNILNDPESQAQP